MEAELPGAFRTGGTELGHSFNFTINLYFIQKMKKSFSLAIVFNIWLFTLSLAQMGISEQYFETVKDVFKTSEGKYLVIQEESEYGVMRLDEDGNLESKFLKNGDGPGEARKIEASFFETKTEQLYVKDNDGSIIVYDINGNLIREKIIGKGSITSIDVTENRILLGSRVAVLQTSIKEDTKVKIGSLIDKETFKEIDQLHISLNDMELNKISEINKIRGIMLDTHIASVDKETILVTFNGIPKIFVFKNGTLFSKIDLEKFNDFMIKVTKHKVYGYGIKIPAINNNIQRISESLFIITHGNAQQNLPNGYQLIEVINKKEDIELNVSAFADIEVESSSELNSFRMKFYEDRYYIFDGITRFANQIYVQ